ncbi:unnamed protein product [Arctia plantaginis]|uniref:Uncharacterized protein n=1 Tax=Arctia plantaginis TaxID=874455 RepID=A0A8S0YQY5_ARCPL|nr:unnamed protein product [Arctia plantaginis]
MMTMFILLTIVSVIHGGMSALVAPPAYVETHREVIAEGKAIEDNILSMINHIPLLNDSRRHFAELVHVIYVAAYETGRSCIPIDYNQIIEEASVEALSKPEKVIKTVKKVYEDLDSKTKTLQELIETIMTIKLDDVFANSMIDLIVNAAPEKYAEEAKLHLICGKSANKFNKKKDLFNKLSKELDTHKFVVTEFDTLMDLVYASADVSRILYPFPNLKC